jgi:prepilin-type N-terminal cleavage/methylation domain-containing protein/prepilin-type processing-associated H-X9-DG protein
MKNYTQLPSARRAFTLIELLTVIAIIGILAAILIPVVGSVREQAKDSVCKSNLRQMHMAWVLFANDHNGLATTVRRPAESGPRPSEWIRDLAHYMGLEFPGARTSPARIWWLDGHLDNVFKCPGDQHTHGHTLGDLGPENYVSYCYNDHVFGYLSEPSINIDTIKPDIVVLADNARSFYFASTSWSTARGAIGFRHNNKANMVMVGGNVYVANGSNRYDPPRRFFTVNDVD